MVRGGRRFRPPVGVKPFASVRFRIGEPLEDERVCLVGQLGDERKIIAAEAVSVLRMAGGIRVSAGKRHVVVSLLLSFVFPNGGFDAAESEGLHRKFRADGDRVLLRCGWSVFRGHLSSFVCEERDCSLAPKAEAPAGTRSRLGGFLSRRTRAISARAATARLEVPPERASMLRKRNEPPWRTCPRNADRALDVNERICTRRGRSQVPASAAHRTDAAGLTPSLVVQRRAAYSF